MYFRHLRDPFVVKSSDHSRVFFSFCRSGRQLDDCLACWIIWFCFFLLESLSWALLSGGLTRNVMAEDDGGEKYRCFLFRKERKMDSREVHVFYFSTMARTTFSRDNRPWPSPVAIIVISRSCRWDNFAFAEKLPWTEGAAAPSSFTCTQRKFDGR